jgi:predicted HAD superfamily Cof-like phosphohydrolase
MTGSPWRLVREFHERCGRARADQPRLVGPELAESRQRLLEEEVAELSAAARAGQLDEIARELADVVYVAYGTAVSYGIDLDAVLAEVHRANMSKIGPSGRPVIRSGKVQKGEWFRPPDVAAVLRRQAAAAAACDGASE